MSNVHQDEQAVNPASPEFFFEAEKRFAEATEAVRQLIGAKWSTQQELSAGRDALKDTEARIIANGVDGKNAEERTANLRVLMAEDQEAEHLRLTLIAREGEAVGIDQRLERQRGAQALARYRLRYADATLRYLANIPPESPHESRA